MPPNSAQRAFGHGRRPSSGSRDVDYDTAANNLIGQLKAGLRISIRSFRSTCTTMVHRPTRDLLGFLLLLAA
eukprot:scaffold28434_cov67-Phaeocystis_antarctica.AAC.2